MIRKPKSHLKQILFFLIFQISFFSTFAGTGKILFVETGIDLRADGSAVIAYTIQWKVISGEFHGFYFQGNENLVIKKFSDKSFAVDDQKNQFKLEIKKVGQDKWDIILAEGKGVNKGTVTYKFLFETNFAEPGYLGRTKSSDNSDLVFFNWSPVQWDDSFDHYTLSILTPFLITEADSIRKQVSDHRWILTEEFMNSEYLIDYQKGPNDRLKLLFHKNEPPTGFKMKTQFLCPVNGSPFRGIP